MIAIGCDHWGTELKAHLIDFLKNKGYEVCDKGTYTKDSVDYPVYAAKVAKDVADGTAEFGILICGTGMGMSMMANRFNNVRAALCMNELMAKMSRAHNNANVLCMGANLVGKGLAEAMTEAFLTAEFEGGRHERRIAMFEDKNITG